MRLLTWLLVFLFTAVAQGQDPEAEREAYRIKRAMEKAAAEQAVRDLSALDQTTLLPDDAIRLAYAYNELGDNRLALAAVCRVPENVLAEKKQLDLKAICFHNMNFGDDKSARIRELAFIDRCLDRKVGNEGVWLWRKAKVVCQSSVSAAVATVGDNIGHEAQVIDREQYEYAFELLARAFKVEPDLFDMAGVGHAFTWATDFPLLSQEQRFKELMKKKPGAEAAPPTSSGCIGRYAEGVVFVLPRVAVRGAPWVE